MPSATLPGAPTADRARPAEESEPLPQAGEGPQGMLPDLGLDDPGRFVRKPRVPILDAHEHPTKGVVDAGLLKLLADNSNRRASRGNPSLILIGHTRDDATESEYPPVAGFAKDFVVGSWQGRPCLLADLYFRADKVQDAMEFPHRSVERAAGDQPAENFIDAVSLLRRPAERDLGVLTYARDSESRLKVIRYCRDFRNGKMKPGPCKGKKNKKKGLLENLIQYARRQAAPGQKGFRFGEDDKPTRGSAKAPVDGRPHPCGDGGTVRGFHAGNTCWELKRRRPAAAGQGDFGFDREADDEPKPKASPATPKASGSNSGDKPVGSGHKDANSGHKAEESPRPRPKIGVADAKAKPQADPGRPEDAIDESEYRDRLAQVRAEKEARGETRAQPAPAAPKASWKDTPAGKLAIELGLYAPADTPSPKPRTNRPAPPKPAPPPPAAPAPSRFDEMQSRIFSGTSDLDRETTEFTKGQAKPLPGQTSFLEGQAGAAPRGPRPTQGRMFYDARESGPSPLMKLAALARRAHARRERYDATVRYEEHPCGNGGSQEGFHADNTCAGSAGGPGPGGGHAPSSPSQSRFQMGPPGYQLSMQGPDGSRMVFKNHGGSKGVEVSRLDQSGAVTHRVVGDEAKATAYGNKLLAEGHTIIPAGGQKPTAKPKPGPAPSPQGGGRLGPDGGFVVAPDGSMLSFSPAAGGGFYVEKQDRNRSVVGSSVMDRAQAERHVADLAARGHRITDSASPDRPDSALRYSSAAGRERYGITIQAGPPPLQEIPD